MATKKKLLQAAAGAAGGGGLNVEDVFSTYLYEGTGATQTITNGIDLSGEGGLVWIKDRESSSNSHFLYDTERGVGTAIKTDGANAAQTRSTGLTAFNSNGFTLGSLNAENGSGNDKASWTFRKAPKFFDVVTYTGTGSTQNISHSLGAVPAVMMVFLLIYGIKLHRQILILLLVLITIRMLLEKILLPISSPTMTVTVSSALQGIRTLSSVGVILVIVLVFPIE
jgi:hypothetical protein